MSTFDPYHKWLGISPADQPAHYYRLLGVDLFEADPDVIESAADRQMTYIRQCATGPFVKESQKILNELAAARVCLLNAGKKAAYDVELKEQLGTTSPAPVAPGKSRDRMLLFRNLKLTTHSEPDCGPRQNRLRGRFKRRGTRNTTVDVAPSSKSGGATQKLLDEQNYDAAIPILVTLTEFEGTLFKESAAWAKSELPVARQKQQKLRERVAAACAKARKLMETYNYAEVTDMLEALPASARTDDVRQLLSVAGQRFEDCLGLQQEIDTAVRSKNYEHLLPLVKRFLKIKPDNTKMQRLAADLGRNRADRAVRNYKGTGKYFDVAGKLVEPKEIAGACCLSSDCSSA